MDELKQKISQNLLSILTILSFFILLTVYIVTQAVLEADKQESVKLLEECTKTCRNDVEAFFIDESGKPVCKCNTGVLRRIVDKLFNE